MHRDDGRGVQPNDNMVPSSSSSGSHLGESVEVGMEPRIARSMEKVFVATGNYLSKPRQDNVLGETFTMYKRGALSSDSGYCVYQKSVDGKNTKLALVFFWLRADNLDRQGKIKKDDKGNDRKIQWVWQALTQGHVLGLQRLPEILARCEEANYNYNVGELIDHYEVDDIMSGAFPERVRKQESKETRK